MTAAPTPGQKIQPEDIRRWGPKWSYRVGTALSKLWKVDITGLENIPRHGRVIIAANHTGIIDGPLLHGLLPRPSHFIIKEEAFYGVVGALMRLAGQIPVDRSSGRGALTTALALLKEERIVGVFPEGTRGRGDVADAKAGIAWLAVRSQAPVVPVALLGTRMTGDSPSHIPRFRSRIYVRIGEPFHPYRSDLRGRAAIDAALGSVRENMSAHVQHAINETGIELPDDA